MIIKLKIGIIFRVLSAINEEDLTLEQLLNALPMVNHTPAPQVEFELRHTREHLEKLKFNWLELSTKRDFLHRLSAAEGEEWRGCGTSRWTPGELKQLERSLEPDKAKLKTEKSRTNDLLQELGDNCEQISGRREQVREKRTLVRDLVQEFREQSETLRSLREQLPSTPIKSVDELQGTLDEQSIALEKQSAALERQRLAVADLERLLGIHQVEVAKLETQAAELSGHLNEIRATHEAEGPEARIAELCRWYSTLADTLIRLASCKVEMIRPDYLLLTLTHETLMVPVHVHVDSISGRLLSAKVGATSATPKRTWRDIIDAAVEFNDIPFLVRAIHQVIKQK